MRCGVSGPTQVTRAAIPSAVLAKRGRTAQSRESWETSTPMVGVFKLVTPQGGRITSEVRPPKPPTFPVPAGECEVHSGDYSNWGKSHGGGPQLPAGLVKSLR